MSPDSPQSPDLERVEKGVKAVTSLTNTLTEFLHWVAGMIHKRQWVELLMLAIAVAIVFWGTKITIAQVIAEPVFYGIWIVLGVVFLAGVILELRKKPPLKIISRDIGKRKAIKFLSSFEQQDAEIYTRLQGYRDLGIILENIVRPEFSFGILKGKSGCGKSSYLKAGLLAELAKTETYRGVYIKFSNQDSLETIREALVDSLKLPQAEIEALNFLELLKKAIEAASQSCENFKSLILIFDQFEQFFVYTDDEAKRDAFIRDLATWYNDDELTEKVKILVSIREDWLAQMDEVQEVLNYTLRIGSRTGGNSFHLKNFSAEEATMILAVMAQEDLGIEINDSERFDRDYIQALLEEELASPTDRLISTVDLQIIAETIKQQNTAEMRAFNRKALQKLGGIEGLRRSFLESILEPLGAERKKSAVQVLVSLTNLEQQTRAKVQTLEQLQEKVKGTVPPDEGQKLVNYLQGTGLIAVVERKGIKGYELAHEGMISAVIRLGEKIQDKAYRANQLLERRVNEWLGNNRSSRYLFNLGELWSIERQKSYLIWGSKRQQKQQLIAQSKGRIYRNFGLVGGVLLLGMVIWSWLNYTTSGQLTQIRWKLTDVSQQISDPKYQAKAVAAFAKDRNLVKALKLINQIENDSSRANALRAIVETIGKLNLPEQAAQLLQDAIASANQIENDSSRANALRAIVETIGKLNLSEEKAAQLLQDAIASANQIGRDVRKLHYRVDALRAIAEAIGKLNLIEEKLAKLLLQDAIASANQIEDDQYQALALRYRADALSAIAEAIGKLNQPEQAAQLLQDAIASANQILDRYQDDALSAIVEAIGKLNLPEEKAAQLLQDAIASANQIRNDKSRADALSAIAEAYSKLNQPEAVKLLQDAIASANQIENDRSRADALSAIAEAYSKLKKWGQALKVTQECPSFDCEVELLAKILTIYAEQQHPELKEEEEKNN